MADPFPFADSAPDYTGRAPRASPFCPRSHRPGAALLDEAFDLFDVLVGLRLSLQAAL